VMGRVQGFTFGCVAIQMRMVLVARRPAKDLLSPERLTRVEDTMAQEHKARAPVHLTFQKFELVDMSLGWPIAPGQGEATFYRLVVFQQSLGTGA
jgi:hypothetical protein